jgi:hypothetical protein
VQLQRLLVVLLLEPLQVLLLPLQQLEQPPANVKHTSVTTNLR